MVHKERGVSRCNDGSLLTNLLGLMKLKAKLKSTNSTQTSVLVFGFHSVVLLKWHNLWFFLACRQINVVLG